MKRKKLDLLARQAKGKKQHRKNGDKKDTSSSKLDSLPLDLQVEILTKLSVKSLMKFRCVSKMWSSIIRSQRFIDSFHAMSSKRSRFIITVSMRVSDNDDVKRLFFFSSSYEAEESSTLVTNLDMTIPPQIAPWVSRSPSLHGFLGYLDVVGLQFTICNPSTGQVIRVPIKSARTSFGYDPIEDQIKLLTIVTSPHSKNPPCKLVHEVITLKGEKESSWIRNEITTPPYVPADEVVCINGILYRGAWAPREGNDPVIACFDVRYERLSFIKAPKDVLVGRCDTLIPIDYKGKLAFIVRFRDLWILEDVTKHDWSKQTIELPPYPFFSTVDMTSPGTNKAGEIIFAPKFQSGEVEPFYIFYYNVEKKHLRKVRLQGIGDTEEFRHRYGLVRNGCVSISAKHVESIASL